VMSIQILSMNLLARINFEGQKECRRT
jgi:hypothetical protein